MLILCFRPSINVRNTSSMENTQRLASARFGEFCIGRMQRLSGIQMYLRQSVGHAGAEWKREHAARIGFK